MIRYLLLLLLATTSYAGDINSSLPVILASPVPLPVSQSGTWNITNITGTVSLPTGAATSANQSTEITALTSIQSTSNSTAVNTNSILANQTNGTQRTLVTDLVGNLLPSGDAPARTIYVKVNDGTNSTVVKAASTGPAFTDTALEVTQRPDTLGTVTETSISCGTSSTTLLAASTATMFISVRNPTTSTNTIWIRFDGAAATAAVPSIDIAPGAEADFFAYGPSFLPTSQFNCISGGTASSVALVYK